jgi:hypothetical protein
MNIGSLYKVKKWFWFLFPTKETAAATPTAAEAAYAATVADGIAAAAWYSKQLNCEVTYFSLDSYIVFLEEDGLFKKVLTFDGKIGWTWFDEDYIDCFEEVETEES